MILSKSRLASPWRTPRLKVALRRPPPEKDRPTKRRLHARSIEQASSEDGGAPRSSRLRRLSICSTSLPSTFSKVAGGLGFLAFVVFSGVADRASPGYVSAAPDQAGARSCAVDW